MAANSSRKETRLLAAQTTQIAAREFDGDFFRLPQPVQAQVQRIIDAMSLRFEGQGHE